MFILSLSFAFGSVGRHYTLKTLLRATPLRIFGFVSICFDLLSDTVFDIRLTACYATNRVIRNVL